MKRSNRKTDGESPEVMRGQPWILDCTEYASGRTRKKANPEYILVLTPEFMADGVWWRFYFQ